MKKRDLFGGIEAGGTKFVCVVGKGPEEIAELTRFPTTTPEKTLGQALDFLSGWRDRLQAIGVGSFGPLDVRSDSPTYGSIEGTPKPGWSGTDVLGSVKRLGLPVAIDMDVAASAMGEYKWGAGQGRANFLYVTVGTGIGASLLLEGRPLQGLAAPEMGHLRIPRDEKDDFQGTCPFHGACLEGLAAGPALRARWGESGEELAVEHPAWELEAGYLASGITNFILTLSPERIVLGGGVMEKPGLRSRVCERVLEDLAGYVDRPQLTEEMEAYLVPPALGSKSGVLGCLAMARQLVGAED